MRVLIADDDPRIRMWLPRAMGALGHYAEAVADAETLALRAVVFAPEGILTDIELPGLDGIAAGLWVRKTLPGCRVVLMTGDPGRADEARRAGFSEVLDKPFTLENLLRALNASGA